MPLFPKRLLGRQLNPFHGFSWNRVRNTSLFSKWLDSAAAIGGLTPNQGNFSVLDALNIKSKSLRKERIPARFGLLDYASLGLIPLLHTGAVGLLVFSQRTREKHALKPAAIRWPIRFVCEALDLLALATTVLLYAARLVIAHLLATLALPITLGVHLTAKHYTADRKAACSDPMKVTVCTKTPSTKFSPSKTAHQCGKVRTRRRYYVPQYHGHPYLMACHHRNVPLSKRQKHRY